MKRFTAVLLLTYSFVLSFGQSKFSIEGIVLNSSDSTIIEIVPVILKEQNIWTITDAKGNFILKNVKPGEVTLQASYLGFEPFEKTIKVTGNIQALKIYMNPISLGLSEVVVTAREGKKMGSSSTINQSALQHVQPTDLSDIMQLLPGQVTVNPNLSGTKQLSIREISSSNDPNASLGTLLIIDGAPVSNDANMQFTNRNGTAGFSTSITGGTDVRQISVDNIESVEVIRGIAGVENGDILSGAVKVNLKKGSTPFTAKIKADPAIKQLYLGKGFLLPKGKGSLNTDFDLTQSLDDVRFKYKTFNRLNGGIGYSSSFFTNNKPLRFNASVRASQTLDVYQKDPDMRDYEKYESKDQSLSATMSGKWALNSLLLTNLDFNVSGNIQHQLGKEITQESLNGAMPQPLSRVSGEFVTFYLPSSYISDLSVDGKPFYMNSKLSGSKSFHFGEVLNNFIFGANWKLSGNNGLGRIYDPSRPPSPSSSSDARPRSYKDIPSMKELALYVEENFSAPISTTKLDIQAGLRFTNIQPDGLFSSQVNTTMLDPRLNIKYSIIDKKGNRNLKSLEIRFGWGSFSKSPTMLHYYPDKAYFDRVSFNYYDPPNSLLVLTTKIYEDTRNYQLKPAVNKKFDGGLDFAFRSMNASFTGFYEKMNDGFSFERFYDINIYNLYEPLTQGGLNPYYIPENGVYYNDLISGDPVKVSSSPDSLFVSYSYPSNNDQTVKKGIEFTLDFGTVKFLRTSFVLDGAYMNIRKQSINEYFDQTVTSYLGKPFPLVGIYPGGAGSIHERLNSNLRTITHIKELRMVFTITTQIIWMQKTRFIYNDAHGNPVFYTKNTVDDLYSDIEQVKYVNPIGYYDLSQVYRPFDPSTAILKPYSDLIMAYNDPRYFISRIYPPAFQINLRLTKEISDKIDFSFYANNLTNYHPLTEIKGFKNAYVLRNQSLYFGAEIRIRI
jgi:hypothetical protein